MIRLDTITSILVAGILAATSLGNETTVQEPATAQQTGIATAIEKMQVFEPFIGEWFMNEYEVDREGSPLGPQGEKLDRVMVIQREMFDSADVAEIVLVKANGERFVVWKEFIGWDSGEKAIVAQSFGIVADLKWLSTKSIWKSEGDKLIRKYSGTANAVSRSGLVTFALTDGDTLSLHYTNGKIDGNPVDEEPPKKYARRK